MDGLTNGRKEGQTDVKTEVEKDEKTNGQID
jgi:hypothetical protein